MAKILIVDDQHELLDMVSMCLNHFGFITGKADSANQLIDSLETFKPDLIILDVMLGNDDGRKVCKQIKESEHGNIPIILYSAAAHLLENFRQYHADASIEKPFDIYLLKKKIEAMLPPDIH